MGWWSIKYTLEQVGELIMIMEGMAGKSQVQCRNSWDWEGE